LKFQLNASIVYSGPFVNTEILPLRVPCRHSLYRNSAPCPCFKAGDTFVLERNGERDDFWRMLDGKFCSEAWDCVSRYVYAALQGGSIMRGWTNDEKMMIACCNDGTRPVIFKIERIDIED